MLVEGVTTALVFSVVAYIYGALRARELGEAHHYWWTDPADEGEAMIKAVAIALSWITVLLICLYERRKPVKAAEE